MKYRNNLKYRYLVASILSLLFWSCDDGDIIVTSFEFDEADLQLCKGSLTNEFVFFKINKEIDEAISINFIQENFSDSSLTEDRILIDLAAADNSLVYRQFNKDITANYYCSTLPDSDIRVTNELVNTKGTAEIKVFIAAMTDNDGVDPIDESFGVAKGIDPLADPDEDDVPNYLDDNRMNSAIGDENKMIEDGFDTDGDGIPNFLDQDDDNDNISTFAELPNRADPNSDAFEDTDGDGTPNFLDKDDDGDGILTRNEDIDGSGNPRDDDTDKDGIPNFLDDDDDGDDIMTKEESPDPNKDGIPTDALDSDNDGIPDYLDTDKDTDVVPVTLNFGPLLRNTIETTYRTSVFIFDLEFAQNSGEFEEGFIDLGFRDAKYSESTDP